MQHAKTEPSFLEFLPVSLFGAIMGLTGLSFSWEWAHKTWAFSPAIKDFIGVVATLLFILLTATYLVKAWKHPSIVRSEFQHPVSVSFFGTFIISLILLPGIILPYSVVAAVCMWVLGSILMFVFAWIVLRKWLDHQQDHTSASPAWILPVVGTLDVPIVGYRIPIPGVNEVCLLFFAIGLLFTLILFPIIITRLLFNPPLPEAVQPTLMIMVGPFSLAYSGYVSISGHDIAASILFYSALFLLILFGSKIFLLPKCCPFHVSWWSVSFPLVAITVASFRYSQNQSSSVFQLLSAVLLTVSTGTIFYLLVQTIFRLFANKLYSNNKSGNKQ
jgi:tellurite resistance protein